MTIKRLFFFLLAFMILFFGMPEVMESDGYFRLKQFLFDRNNADSADSDLFIPNVADSEDDVFYNDHFFGDKGYFVLTINELLMVYSSPNIDMNSNNKLSPVSRVRILFRDQKEVLVDEELRRWVFISSEDGAIRYGWVFEDQLVFPQQFQLMESLSFSGFSYERGEFQADIEVVSSNQFIMSWSAEGNGLYLNGQDSGFFYTVDDIIWAKKNNIDYIFDFFVLDSDVLLEQESRFTLDPITMNVFLNPK